MVLDERQGIFIPEIVDRSRVSGDGPEFVVCPGKGLDIGGIAQEIYGPAPHQSYELGRYRTAVAARMVDDRILENASSGAVMTGIARHLLEKGLVEGVTASRFVYGGKGPRTECFVARNLEDLIAAQGSKYCPTDMNRLVQECVQAGGRHLFAGTPCQVGALRLAMEQDPQIAQAFPYTMANFCGGYRDFRNLDNILSTRGLDPSRVTYFRFRGAGQPGSMLARTADGRTASEAYPKYMHHRTVAKQKRCSYCVDATGELADFACGDAWINRLLADKHPWSIVLARSRFAQETLNEMASAGLMMTEPLTPKEIIDSQRLNITSKKYRQHARMRVSRMLGIAMPRWDVQLPQGDTGYLREAFVLFQKTSLGLRLGRIRYAIRKALGPRL